MDLGVLITVYKNNMIECLLSADFNNLHAT